MEPEIAQTYLRTGKCGCWLLLLPPEWHMYNELFNFIVSLEDFLTSQTASASPTQTIQSSFYGAALLVV